MTKKKKKKEATETIFKGLFNWEMLKNKLFFWCRNYEKLISRIY